MSNVEYRCPKYFDDPPTCTSKLFAPPGGTKLKCRFHDVLFMQSEEQSGPDFLYVDEGGRTLSRDEVVKRGDGSFERVLKDGADYDTAGRTSDDKGNEVVDPDVELAAYRSMFKALTGVDVDKRWGVARIKEELADTFEIRLDPQEVEGASETDEDTAPADDTGGINDSQDEDTEHTENPEYELVIPKSQIVDSIPEPEGDGDD